MGKWHSWSTLRESTELPDVFFAADGSDSGAQVRCIGIENQTPKLLGAFNIAATPPGNLRHVSVSPDTTRLVMAYEAEPYVADGRGYSRNQVLDPNFIAMHSKGSVAQIYDLNGPALVSEFRCWRAGTDGGVRTSFSSSGSRLMVYDTKFVELYDEDVLQRTWQDDEGRVIWRASLSPDGTLLAVMLLAGNDVNEFRVWDVSDGRFDLVLEVLRPGIESVDKLVFSDSNMLLLLLAPTNLGLSAICIRLDSIHPNLAKYHDVSRVSVTYSSKPGYANAMMLNRESHDDIIAMSNSLVGVRADLVPSGIREDELSWTPFELGGYPVEHCDFYTDLVTAFFWVPSETCFVVVTETGWLLTFDESGQFVASLALNASALPGNVDEIQSVGRQAPDEIVAAQVSERCISCAYRFIGNEQRCFRCEVRLVNELSGSQLGGERARRSRTRNSRNPQASFASLSKDPWVASVEAARLALAAQASANGGHGTRESAGESFVFQAIGFSAQFVIFALVLNIGVPLSGTYLSVATITAVSLACAAVSHSFVYRYFQQSLRERRQSDIALLSNREIARAYCDEFDASRDPNLWNEMSRLR